MGRIAILETDHLDNNIIDALQDAASPSATNLFVTADELATKAELAHTHAIADVTGLQAAIDEKSPTTHTHVISDVTGLTLELDGLSLNKANAVHTHIIDDVSGLQNALDNKSETTHTHDDLPSTDQKQAMDAASPAPSISNPFVTESYILGLAGLLTESQKASIDGAYPVLSAINPVVTEGYLSDNNIAGPTVQNNTGGYTNGSFSTTHYPKEVKVVINGVTYAMPARIV
jgi:hypothetical protein